MRKQNTWRRYAKEGLVVAAIGVILVASLPLLAVAAFTVRAVFVVSILAGIVILVSSARFRQWLFADDVDQHLYKGLRVPQEVMLGDAHSWARHADHAITVGADDLAQRALGPVDRIDLPATGSFIERGQPLFKLHRDDRWLDIMSPVAGRVTRVNTQLGEAPTLLNEAPYGIGWAVQVEPNDAGMPRRTLRRGREARDWFRSEVDRLIAMTSVGHEGAVTMHDGGAVVDDLHREIDDDSWDWICAAVFGRKA